VLLGRLLVTVVLSIFHIKFALFMFALFISFQMVRKRSNACINIDSSQDCDSVESEDIFDSEDENQSDASHGIDVSFFAIIFLQKYYYVL